MGGRGVEGGWKCREGEKPKVFFPEKGKRERHGRWVLLMPELVTSKWRHIQWRRGVQIVKPL